MDNGGCFDREDKIMKKNGSVLDLLINKSTVIIREISDDLSISQELESAIDEENCSDIR